MKRLFTIFLSVAFVFASCAKIEDASVRSTIANGAEIAFSTRPSAATRAIVDGTAMVDNFGVYGYVVPGDYSANGGYLMKNAEYDKDGDAVGGTYYWPQSDNNNGIDFIFTAYSQFVSTPTWENDTLKLAVPALTQALIDNPDYFNDILWTQTAYNHHQNSTAEHERVSLNFKHALSWIQFRGEVTNANIKWAKVKQICFGEYVDTIPATPEQQIAKPQKGILDGYAWNEITTNLSDITDEEIAYINGLFTFTKGKDKTGGNADWVTGNDTYINSYYNSTISSTAQSAGSNGYIEGDFTVDLKQYLNDRHSSFNAGTTGNFSRINNCYLVHIERDGSNVIGWFYNKKKGATSSLTALEYETIPGNPAIPAHSSEGLYVDGILCLPTKDTITVNPSAIYGAQKDTTLNYVSAQVDTIFTNSREILGNALVIPQPVPQNITVVFDICIVNPTGDEIVFTDRKITRTINTGKDMVNVDYTPSWAAANKYIYNFKFDGDKVDFTTSVLGWTDSSNQYYVWDY